MNKRIFIFAFIFALMLFPLVSSENLGTFKVNESMQITNYCNIGSCTYMNITSIKMPNGTVIEGNAVMTKNYQDFNYSYIPSLLGEYNFKTCGNPDGKIICDSDSFIVTKTGKEFKQSEAIIYLVLIVGLIIFLIVAIYGAISIPYSNHRNEEGKLIGVNDLKYIKILSIFLSYGILTWLANLMITISNNYVDLGIAIGFFTIMFKIMMGLLYPTLIFTIIFIVIEATRDFKIKKLLNRGL